MFFYNGSHSVSFGISPVFLPSGKMQQQKNTWSDWYLIPDSRTDLVPPNPVTSFVTIPGRHGTIDMSEILTGGPVYGDRSGSWDFIFDHEDCPDSWTTVRDDMLRYLHNQRRVVVLDDDPTFYLSGRLQIDWKSEAKYSKVTIRYTLEPYKHKWNIGEDWLWDPFNFDTDYTDGTASEQL